MNKFEVVCIPEKSAKLFFNYRYIIHDVAQIVDMTNAKNYTSSLAKLVAKTGNSLDSCHLVNRVECQTKKQS